MIIAKVWGDVIVLSLGNKGVWAMPCRLNTRQTTSGKRMTGFLMQAVAMVNLRHLTANGKEISPQ
jgi:hypothetical protein